MWQMSNYYFWHFSIMKPSVVKLLEEKGLDIPTENPPEDAEETKNPIDVRGKFKNFHSKKMYDASGEVGLEQTKENKYLHLRQYYITQVKTETRNQAIEQKTEELRKILTTGSPEDIEKLYEQRHQWRITMHAKTNDIKPICKYDKCISTAIPGSEYCANHILSDPNQKLYIECPTCHRPHPVCTICFGCGQ